MYVTVLISNEMFSQNIKKLFPSCYSGEALDCFRRCKTHNKYKIIRMNNTKNMNNAKNKLAEVYPKETVND